MLTQIKNPALAGTSEPGLKNTSRTDPTKPKLKWKRVLAAFYAGRSLNRFQSEIEVRDHCLPSTVSVLQEKGVVILRKDEVVPGFQGIPTHVCRYWLAPESLQRAAELLGHTKSPPEDAGEPCALPDEAPHAMEA